MFGSEILDVAIGMSFIFLLFSLICSVLSELFEGFAKNRASDLERGIRELLSHESGDSSVERLYNHPLIYSLFSGAFVSGANKKWWQHGYRLPSYIPAQNFALAIMDLALPATETQVSGAAFSINPAQPGMSLTTLRQSILTSQLLNEKTRRALVTLIDAAGSDMARARQNVEGWFNSAMDRVSGRYKRRTQTILAGIAFAAAVSANVDSIAMINMLSTQKSVRDSLVSVSQQYAQKSGYLALDPKACEGKATADCALSSSIGELKTLGLPIGWTSDPFGRNSRGLPQGWGWGLKLAGWLITAFAACLGASFWFDALNKLMVVRSTVKPREKSQEEKSKE